MVEYFKSRVYSGTEVQVAVNLVKTKRPDLWASLVELEKLEDGLGDKVRELHDLFLEVAGVESVMDTSYLIREIRKQVRIEAGLPV